MKGCLKMLKVYILLNKSKGWKIVADGKYRVDSTKPIAILETQKKQLIIVMKRIRDYKNLSIVDLLKSGNKTKRRKHMIKIHVNNGRTIELSKAERGTLINVDVIDSNGEVDYNYIITESEMVTLLNQFQYENNIS